MSTTALDIASVRARFSALDRRLAFFDGPGGTQCPDEVIEAISSLNFLLTRAFARTLRPGDEIVHTALDHDANVSPWLELAHDLGVVVKVAGLTDDLEVDYDDLAGLISEKTRVVAETARGTILEQRPVA